MTAPLARRTRDPDGPARGSSIPTALAPRDPATNGSTCANGRYRRGRRSSALAEKQPSPRHRKSRTRRWRATRNPGATRARLLAPDGARAHAPKRRRDRVARGAHRAASRPAKARARRAREPDATRAAPRSRRRTARILRVGVPATARPAKPLPRRESAARGEPRLVVQPEIGDGAARARRKAGSRRHPRAAPRSQRALAPTRLTASGSNRARGRDAARPVKPLARRENRARTPRPGR